MRNPLNPPEYYTFVQSLPDPTLFRHVFVLNPDRHTTQFAFRAPLTTSAAVAARVRFWELQPLHSQEALLGTYLGTALVWHSGDHGDDDAALRLEDEAGGYLAALRLYQRRLFFEPDCSIVVMETDDASVEPRPMD